MALEESLVNYFKAIVASMVSDKKEILERSKASFELVFDLMNRLRDWVETIENRLHVLEARFNALEKKKPEVLKN
jgi:hypothetical protein